MIMIDPSSDEAGGAALTFDSAVVAGQAAGGAVFVPASTPLTRLNYYDGRFLRADDLQIEQRAQRALVEYSNQAGGPGLVHGFDVSLDDGVLHLGGGLALDPRGRVLYLPDGVGADVAGLIDASQQVLSTAGSAALGGAVFADCEVATSAAAGVPTASVAQLYLVAIAHAEGLCGNAEVFGRLCDDACITATDRPYRRDGVVLLVVPLTLALPTSTAVPLTSVHLQSRIASAYFAGEWAAGGSLLSAAGLRSFAWCAGAPALAGEIVPVGVLSWSGANGFVDEWTARRERMEAPPRSYWAGRMELRPWPVFLAQVLQFQCQLAHLLVAPPVGGDSDPACEDARLLLRESTKLLAELAESATSGEAILAFTERATSVLNAAVSTGPSNRRLVDGGVIELPPAGYLPIDLASALTVREQAQEWMGAGVELRVCAVRRDQIAHELERAQHMNRISLVAGLDDPSAIQDVDILVPDGTVERGASRVAGTVFQVGLAIGPSTKWTGGGVREPIPEFDGVPDAPAPGFGPDDGPPFQPPSGSPPPASLAMPPPQWFPGSPGAAPQSAFTTGAAPGGFAVADDAAAAAEARRAADERLDGFLREADADPKVLPIEGVARLSVDDAVELHLAALGSASDAQLRRLIGALGHLTQDVEAYERRIARAKFESSSDTATSMMRAVEEIGKGTAKFLSNRRNQIVISLAEALDEPPLAVWFTLRLDRQPWAMAVGDSGTLTGRVVLFLPSTPSRLLDVNVSATFEVRDHGFGERGPSVSLRLTLRTFGEFVNLPDLPDPGAATSVDVDLERESAGSGFALVVRSDPEWRLSLGWLGDPTHAVGSVGYDVDSGKEALSKRSRGLVAGVAVENPAAGVPGSEHQQAAMAALNLLHGFRPDDRTFPGIAAAQLFPPGDGATVEATVRPKHDWVLFRRRRSESCEDEVAPSLPVRTSPIATWVTHAENADFAQELEDFLREGVGRAKWKRIDTADFQPGSATLVTSGAQWRSDWAAAGGRSVVSFVGYAPNGASLDPFLQLRAETLAKALAPAAALAADGEVLPIADPPSPQMVAGTDASVFFITTDREQEPPVVTCVEVFCVKEKAAFFVTSGDVASAESRDVEGEGLIERMGEISFEGDVPDDAALSTAIEGLKACWERVAEETDLAVQPEAVGWIASDIADQQRAEELLRVLADAIGVPYETTVGLRLEHLERCPLRLYVIARVAEPIG